MIPISSQQINALCLKAAAVFPSQKERNMQKCNHWYRERRRREEKFRKVFKTIPRVFHLACDQLEWFMTFNNSAFRAYFNITPCREW